MARTAPGEASRKPDASRLVALSGDYGFAGAGAAAFGFAMTG